MLYQEANFERESVVEVLNSQRRTSCQQPPLALRMEAIQLPPPIQYPQVNAKWRPDMLFLILMLLNSGIWMLLEGTAWERFGQKRFNQILHPTFCRDNAKWNMSICDPDHKITAKSKNELEQTLTLINDRHNCHVGISLIELNQSRAHLKRLRFPFNKVHSNFLSNQPTVLEFHGAVYFYMPLTEYVLYVSVLPQRKSIHIPLTDALSVVHCAMPLVKNGHYEDAVHASLAQLESLMEALATGTADQQQPPLADSRPRRRYVGYNFPCRPTLSSYVKLPLLTCAQQTIACIVLSIFLVQLFWPLLTRLCIYNVRGDDLDAIFHNPISTATSSGAGQTAVNSLWGRMNGLPYLQWGRHSGGGKHERDDRQRELLAHTIVHRIMSAKHCALFSCTACPICLTDITVDKDISHESTADCAESAGRPQTVVVTAVCGHSMCYDCIAEYTQSALLKSRIAFGGGSSNTGRRHQALTTHCSVQCPLCRTDIVPTDRNQHVINGRKQWPWGWNLTVNTSRRRAPFREVTSATVAAVPLTTQHAASSGTAAATVTSQPTSEFAVAPPGTPFEQLMERYLAAGSSRQGSGVGGASRACLLQRLATIISVGDYYWGDLGDSGHSGSGGSARTDNRTDSDGYDGSGSDNGSSPVDDIGSYSYTSTFATHNDGDNNDDNDDGHWEWFSFMHSPATTDNGDDDSSSGYGGDGRGVLYDVFDRSPFPANI